MPRLTFSDMVEEKGLVAQITANGKLYVDVATAVIAAGLLIRGAELGLKVRQVAMTKPDGRKFFRIMEEQKAESAGGKVVSWEEAFRRFREANERTEEPEVKKIELIKPVRSVPVKTEPNVESKVRKSRRAGQFTLDRNVPLPGDYRLEDPEQVVRRRTRYPWRSMKVGDSFWTGLRASDAHDTLFHLRRRLIFATNKAEREGKGSYVIAKEGKGFRVWRVK